MLWLNRQVTMVLVLTAWVVCVTGRHHHRHRPRHRFVARLAAQAASSRLHSSNFRLSQALAAPNSSLSDPDDEFYSEWGQWSSCYITCLQKRTRRCLDARECKDNIQKETRDCSFGSCKQHDEPGKKGSGISRKLQDMVFNLLYNKWSEWSMCTRSCKQRRFRTCAYKSWCKDVLLMEETKCYHRGTNCERIWLEENSLDSQSVSSDDKKPDHVRQVAKPPDPTTCGVRPATPTVRIVGGYESRRGSWPWQVAVTTRRGDQYCGGVLVAPQWAITAAHCIRKNGRRRRILVRVGEYDLMVDEGREIDMAVATDFPHPVFNMDTIEGDIALVKLHQAVPPERSDIGFACIPEETDIIESNTICYAMGWGKIKSTHRFGTDILREAPVPLVDAKKCQGVFDYVIMPSQMCAGYRRGGIDTCAGDSGGPLMCQINKNGVLRWYVYGITSFGEGCALKGKYGIYTRVSQFSEWMKNITQHYVQ